MYKYEIVLVYSLRGTAFKRQFMYRERPIYLP